VSKVPNPFDKGAKLRIKKEEWNVLARAFYDFDGESFLFSKNKPTFRVKFALYK